MGIEAGGCYAEQRRHPRPPGAARARRARARRRRGGPRGVPHGVGRPRRAGRPDEWALGARPRRRVRRRHGGIQIAKAIGARIAVTCSAGKWRRLPRARRRPRARALTGRLARRTAARRSPSGAVDGVDVVLDVIGGEEADRNLARGAPEGHDRPGRPDGRRRGRRSTSACCSPSGSTGSAPCCARRPIEEKIAISRRFADEVLPLFTAGALRPVIDRRFPLDDVADAHRAHGGRRQRRQAPARRALIDAAATARPSTSSRPRTRFHARAARR